MNKKIMILLIGLFLVINVIIAGCSEQKVMKKDDAVEKEEVGGTGLEDDLNESENEEVGVEELDDLDSEFEEIEDLDI